MSDVLVLCYHAVSDSWRGSMALPADRLERQLTHVLERGYVSTTFTEAVLDPPAPLTVAVTFDDGLRSVFDRAHPLLAGLGMVGTAFVPTAFPGREPAAWPGTERWLSTEHAHELAPMSWDELGELAQEGWEIGSHTHTHPALPELGAPELAEELSASKEECERHLGRPCRALAYPYGHVDDRVESATRAAGYEAAAALPQRMHRRSALRWPRVGIYENDPQPRFEAKVGRVRRHLIGWGAGEWVVRHAGGGSRPPG